MLSQRYRQVDLQRNVSTHIGMTEGFGSRQIMKQIDREIVDTAIDRQRNSQKEKQIDREIDRQRNKYIDKQIDREIDRYRSRQIEKQIDKEIDRQIYREMCQHIQE